MARRGRRGEEVIGSMYVMNTGEIFKEAMRVILLHPTHFHSISIFLFSPLPISLFLSHFLITHQRFPQIPSSPPLPRLLSKTMAHIVICSPSSLTFSLLGRAATAQAVSDSYNGIAIDGKRLLIKSRIAWIKLLRTSFWEFLIVVGLVGAFVLSLAALPETLVGGASGFRVVLGVLGVPFCVAFAHAMVVGNLARVVSALERDRHGGLESILKANGLVEGRRKTALSVALLSNVGLRLVECLFEFRMSKGIISLWEVPILVSMYSLVLVFDTVMNVVFYYACKP